MSYFALPVLSYNNNVHTLFDIEFCTQNEIKPIINKTLSLYLSNVKSSIDSRQLEWDKYKKYTNTYEYIHTVIPGTKHSVCKMKPLSRAFFKMIEITRTIGLVEGIYSPIKSFHLAEGPGGFIEALSFVRENDLDNYYGMTLVDDYNNSIPGWKKSKTFLDKTKNVFIETGKTKTGDLMSPTNLRDIYDKHNRSCMIVTGDGGFDFSSDFENQEAISSNLILCQIAFAIACQAKGGSFVLKMFDTFTSSSVDMLYLMSVIYDEVTICKLQSSRTANSEKYIVCKGFRMDDTRNLVITLFHIMKKISDKKCINRVLSIDIPYAFSTKVEEINAILGQQQIECITQTIALIKSKNIEKIENLKKINIQKCTSWCQKQRLAYNNSYTGNKFLTVKQNRFTYEKSVTYENFKNNYEEASQISCETT